MRGILAHMVAGKIELDDAVFDQQVRELLKDNTLPIPDDMHIYYWIYPYEDIIFMRDFVLCSFREKKPAVLQMLKYFPVAYLVSTIPSYPILDEMTKFRHCSIDDEVDIPITIDKIWPPLWPEAIHDQILVGGQGTANAVIARKKK